MPIPLVDRHYVYFVLCGAAARRAAVDCMGLLIFILWFCKSCISIDLDSTTMHIS